MISVIIPAFNEENNILCTINNVKLAKTDIEIIVVDGKSSDNTLEKAKNAGALTLIAEKSRGKQLNYGASVARGEILVFLHADTILPDGYDIEINDIIKNKGNRLGAFKIRINSRLRGIKMVEFFINMRTQIFRLPFGDQAFFIRASFFKELGGYLPIPLMEDFEFIKRAKKKGDLIISDKYVITSGRRWEKKGILRTTLLNQFSMFAFSMGLLSPERLAELYYGR